MSICELRPGNKALIDSLGGDEKLIKRLMALGCIEGTEIAVKRVAPLGDPIVLNLRGFNIAIRKNDAKNILVKGAIQ